MRLIKLIFIILVLVSLNLLSCKKVEPTKLDLAIWHWNSQITFKPNDLDDLHKLGINTIYLHAGQFHYTNANISIINIINKWQAIPNLKIGLVFNFTPEMIRAFATLSNQELAEKIPTAIKETILKAEQAQLNITDIQCDFDVPTSQLSRYKTLLTEIKKVIGNKQLSITSLVDWLDKADYEKLLEVVDLHFPQLYGLSIPQTFDKLKPITSPELVKTELKKLIYSTKPYYVGLATYGYALVFDKTGKLLSIRTDLSLEEISLIPELKLLETRFANRTGNLALSNSDYSGEIFYIFTAQSNIPLGKTILLEGETLVFDRLTSLSLAKTLEIVKKEASGKVKGVCLFRYPQIDESMVLSMPELKATLENQILTPEIELDYQLKTDKELVDVEISLTNKSSVESLYQNNAVELFINLKDSQIFDVESLDFQSNETFFNETPASLRLANKIKFSHSYIARQQKLTANLKLATKNNLSTISISAKIKPAFMSQTPVFVEKAGIKLKD